MKFGKKICAGALALLVGLSVVSIGDMQVQAAENGECRDDELVHPDNKALSGYDIVFVVDNSGSIWKEQEIRDAALRTVADLAVGSDVRIGAVYFADHVYSTYKLTSVEDEASYKDVLTNGLTQTAKDESNRDTNIGEGLKAGLNLFEDQDTERERVIILLSDGINENLAGSASYKANADKETEEQVKIIQDAGYPLYCAFIEKAYGDEDYLRQMVNYFDGGSEYDNRLVTVSDSDINMLADCMAGIFYDLNGSMKYKSITLDSNGGYTFYTPDLNLTRLQVYLNNSDNISAALTDENGKEADGWTEGSSYFFTVDDPGQQQWNLSVDSSSPVTGTVAYYTDICVESELTGDLYRGGQAQLVTEFYDSEGNPLNLQADATVTGEVTVTDPSTGEVLQDVTGLDMTVNGEKAESSSFTIEKTGNVEAHVNISYDEFISLNYTCLKGKSLQLYGPETLKDYAGSFLGMIPAYPHDGGLQVSLKLKDYVKDRDNDLSELSVANLVLTNTENEVTAVIEDGSLKILTKDCGLAPKHIEGTVTISDPDGAVTDVDFTGNVINMILVITVLILFLAVVLIGGYMTYKSKQKRKALVRTYEGYMKSLEEQQEIAEANEEKCEELSRTDTIDKLNEDCSRIYDFVRDEKLSDEVIEILGLNTDDEEEHLAKLSKAMDGIVEHAKGVCKFGEEKHENFAEYKNMAVKSLQSNLKDLKLSVQTMIRENDSTGHQIEEMEELTGKIGEDQESISEIAEFVDFIKDKKFNHTVTMNIKRRQAIIYKNSRTWYRMMDQADMINVDVPEKLGEYYGVKTGIMFLPFEQKDEETGRVLEGVIAVSDKNMTYRDSSESEEDEHSAKSVVIPVGASYRFEIDKVGCVFIQAD